MVMHVPTTCCPTQWYAHTGTTVWLVTAGTDRVKGLTYWDKGWTSFEYALAMMIKVANTSVLADWPQVRDLGKEGDEQVKLIRPAPAEPLAFFGGHEYGNKTYTNGADMRSSLQSARSMEFPTPLPPSPSIPSYAGALLRQV
jgi:hypothetical protein